MSYLNNMSDDEVHEFGINFVLDDLRQNGFMILAIATDKSVNPQITAKRNGLIFHILVRTACYPKKGKIESREIGTKFINEAEKLGVEPYFASIGIANANGTTDLERSTLIRGGNYYVAYTGIEELTRLKLSPNTDLSHLITYNQKGEIAGSVVEQVDGRHTISVNKEADMNALLMSLCLVFANDLDREQKILFSKWAHLSEVAWTQSHQQVFSQALFHFFMETKVNGGSLPLSVLEALQSFPPQALIQLNYPLTGEIRSLFSSLFGS